MSNKPVYISMLIATLFWSGAFIAGKMAGTVFLPLTLTFFRFLFALPFIFLLLKLKEPDNFVPAKEQIMPLIILGIVGTLGYHYFFFMALRYTTATNSALIGATNPMVTTVLAVLFFKEKITALRLVGVGISLFGVFGVVTGLDPQIIGAMAFNQGDLIMFVGVLCFSVYALLSRKFMLKYQISPLTVTAYSFLVCTILSLVLGLLLENPLATLGQAPGRVWVEILYMSILASVIGYYVQLNSIQKIGAPKTMMFVNLVPVHTIVLAAVILGEKISLLKLLMAFVIILGVYLAARPEKTIEKQ
ncbi:MAG TPA: DMT family transporter [Peptococcaceae bacterium]|nr:DMT family transporter [Peptococcaceae bacterium]